MTRPYLIRTIVQLHAREASAAPAASFKRIYVAQYRLGLEEELKFLLFFLVPA